MVRIDGRQLDIVASDYANLEEILVKVMEHESLADRIVTDVMLNDEAFSELYPHQAEDIPADEVRSLEIVSISNLQMARDMTDELYKVIGILEAGSRRVAALMREGDLSEGLEVLQDLLDVARNFLSTVGVLRDRYPAVDESEIKKVTGSLNSLLEEMNEVLGNQDWLLMADLLEFEFQPACREWQSILDALRADIAKAA